ncbi:hypothetical protein Clacol_000224 [Clathrus columnatus]|uniref:Cytochrome P450 n=1 Tax=Clathrus columnatus TaxID=1419009 RepID=A0AAV4ZY07_9AGAM|nr:hypothetical protein Clacol_000224 [Clathrus columnatus]
MIDYGCEKELGVRWLLAPSLLENPYHVHILRGQLSNSKTLGAVFNEVYDEVKLAFDDTFTNTDDWMSIPAYATFLQIISRTTARLLVGEPLCHNPKFLGNVLGCVVHVIHGKQTLGVFPSFLKPLAAKYLTNVPQSIEATSKFLQPIIHERREQLATFEDDTADKPLDFLSWLLDEAKGEEQTLRALTLRLLFVSFASIHSTSMTFTHAIYNLVVCPEYKLPLREEIKSIIEKEGWSRESINKMAKLDSFLKESLRLNKTHTASLHRKIRAFEFVFSDGTRVPRGTAISAVELPVHPDPSIAKQFNGFRYVNEKEKGQHTNHFVSTGLDYLAFGHGKRVCPGRFSANDSLKTLLAYFILNYDVRFKDESASRPPNVYNGVGCLPNPVAEVMIRRRKPSI